MGRHATSLQAAEARVGMPFVDLVRLRLSEGQNLVEIAHELGVAKSLPYYWLLQAGYEIRTTRCLVRLRPALPTIKAKT